MIRAAVISLLASPAYAATLPAIQIEECRAVESSPHQSMVPGQIAPNAAQTCEWPGPPDLPPLDMASLDPLALKSVNPPSPVSRIGRAVLPVATSLSWSRNVQAATGGASAWASAYAGASSFSSSEARCGCVTEPDKPEPSPVPLPAGLPLYAALMGALGLLWRWRG